MDLLAEWREEEKKKRKTLAYRTVGCAMNMKVYSKLGPGLLESVYKKAMLIELDKQGIEAERK